MMSYVLFCDLPEVGFEPTSLARLAPEASVYASFTTPAILCISFRFLRTIHRDY